MKKIFITGVPDIGNQGSFAMFKVFIDYMNRISGGYTYILETDNVAAAQQTISSLGIENVEIILDDFSVRASGKLDLAVKYFSKLLRYKYNVRRRELSPILLKKLSECDAIVNIGGDTLSHSSGQFNTIIQLDKLLLGKYLGLRTAILAQTLGIYKNPYLKLIGRKMRKIDLITVREDLSLQYMHALGFKRVFRTSDLAFLLEPTNYLAKELQLEKLGKFACLVPSSMLYRKTFSDISDVDKKYTTYLDVVKYITDKLLKKGFKVLLIPHVFVKAFRDDLDAKHIKQELYSQDDRVTYYDRQFYAHEVKEIVKYSECVISFRMHPTVAAVSQQIPAFLITDSHKGKGVLGQLEPERFVISCRGLSQFEVRSRIESSLPEFLDLLKDTKCSIEQNSIRKVREGAEKNFILLEKLIAGKNIKALK